MDRTIPNLEITQANHRRLQCTF